MSWIRMTADFDYHATPAVTIAYRAGQTYNVPSAAATLAVASGKAVRMRKVSKDAEPVAEPVVAGAAGVKPGDAATAEEAAPDG